MHKVLTAIIGWFNVADAWLVGWLVLAGLLVPHLGQFNLFEDVAFWAAIVNANVWAAAAWLRKKWRTDPA